MDYKSAGSYREALQLSVKDAIAEKKYFNGICKYAIFNNGKQISRVYNNQSNAWKEAFINSTESTNPVL